MNMLCPKTPIVKDKKHVVFLHRLPDIISGYEGPEIVVHHCTQVPTNERGMGRRTSDTWGVPLQDWRHKDLHHSAMNELAYFARFGIYAPALAALLYRLTGNEDACRRAILEMRNG